MTSDERDNQPAEHRPGDTPVPDEMADYLQVYLDETDDELDAIVEALLTLESGPSDRTALDEAFRLLHTLKGSAGMMGFTSVSELAHQLETRIESFRSGREIPGPESMSLLLKCVDYLKGFHQSLRRNEQPDSDVSALIRKLADPEGTSKATDGAPRKSADEARSSSPAIPNTLVLEGQYRVTVEFEPHLQLADLKARLIVARLSRVGEIVATEPSIDDMQSVDDLTGFSIVVMCTEDPASVREIADVDGVREVKIEGRAMHTSQSLAESTSSVDIAGEVPAIESSQPDDEPVAQRERQAPSTLSQEPAPPTPEDTPSLPAEQTDQDPAASQPESIEPERDATAVTATVRVDIERLDNLMNLTGELVVNRARFTQIVETLGLSGKGRRSGSHVRDLRDRLRQKLKILKSLDHDDSVHNHVAWKELESDLNELEHQTNDWDEFRRQCGQVVEAVDQLKRVSSRLQQGVLDTRMVPIAPLFSRFRRVIRDLSAERGKRVRLTIDGEKTELDKRMIDELGDPLIHLVRNSIDHGIESVDERRRLGKAEQGVIHLSASHTGNNVLIAVSDDGAGISVDRVRRRILARELATDSALRRMTDSEVLEHLWLPGFSTAETVTKISGRGVGLDVVRDRITSLNGTVDLTSSAGQGTTFNIRLPLTLAIMRSLLVRFRNGVFSIPIDDVREIVSVPPARVQTIHDRRTINVRGEFIRIASMDELFRWNVPDTATGVPAANAATTAGHDQLNVVMIRSGDRTLGLCVDELLGSSDVVIKSLSDNFREIPGLSGASVMGTGAVSLMIDVHALIQLA